MPLQSLHVSLQQVFITASVVKLQQLNHAYIIHVGHNYARIMCYS